MKDNNYAIRVEGVKKHFLLPHKRAGTLKSLFINPFSRTKTDKQLALDNVSFEVKKGEFFGVVGRNGSGKSTLLKCMAGVYTPDGGTITINGSLVPFIELGVGFNPELSGRDNVYLNGALLGFSRAEVDKMYDEIVEFAELEDSMDQLLKNYSSGMQVRLAFSIAIRAQSDILLLDEVLAVGDESFRRKCLEYFENIKLAGRTVVFVSHDMNSVRQFCTKAVLIDSGKVVSIGKPEIIVEEYSKINLESSNKSLEKLNARNKLTSKIEDYGNGKAEILDIWTTDGRGKKKSSFGPHETIVTHVKIRANEDIKESAFGLTFSSQNGLDVFATNTEVEKTTIPPIAKKEEITISVEVENQLADGFYQVSSAITDITRKQKYSRVVNLHKFEVGGWELRTGMFKLKNKISVK